jgi:hypothetical protein
VHAGEFLSSLPRTAKQEHCQGECLETCLVAGVTRKRNKSLVLDTSKPNPIVLQTNGSDVNAHCAKEKKALSDCASAAVSQHVLTYPANP